MGSDSEMDIGVTGDSSGAVAAFDALTAAQTRYFESLADQAETSSSSVGNLNAAFEHSGVHILNHELLSMIGLGGQSRATMGLMSAGIGEFASSIDLSMATLAPWLLGIGAAVMVGKKLYDSYKENAGALDESIKSMEEGIDKSSALTQSFDHYRSSVGDLTPELGKLEAANRSLADAEKVLLTIELQEKLQKLQEDQSKLAEITATATLGDAAAAAEYSNYAAGSEQANKASKNLAESTAQYDVKAKQLAATIASVQAELTILASGQTNVKKFLDDSAEASDKAQASFDKMMDKADEMATSYAKEYATAEKSIDSFIRKNDEKNKKLNAGDEKDDKYKAQFDAQVEASDAAYKEMEDKARQYGDSTTNLEKSRTETIAALQKNYDQKVEEDQRESFGLQKSNLEDFQNAAKGVANSFASGFSNAFAQMVVNGKNFTQSMHQLFKTMEVDVIQSLTEIAMKDVALKIWQAIQGTAATTTATATQTASVVSGAAAQTAAVTTSTMAQKALFASLAGTAAFADSAEAGPPGLAAAPGVATAAYSAAFAAATGFDGLVDGPTHFIAGEAGQTESVKITPLGAGAGGSGGSGSSQSTQVNVTVSAAGVVTDLTAFANMMAQKTAQAIRGQGQIQMVRGT